VPRAIAEFLVLNWKSNVLNEGEVANFTTELVAMAKSVKQSENEDQIYNLYCFLPFGENGLVHPG